MDSEYSSSITFHTVDQIYRFKLGKLKSKYLIIDILGFGCSFQESFDLLYFSCRSLRTLYCENNPLLFNTSQVKPMQSLDVSMILPLYGNNWCDGGCFNVEAFMDHRIRMLTNHEIVVIN